MPDNRVDEPGQKPRKKVFSAARIFEDWSRPIGLVLLLAYLYVEVYVGHELSDVYPWIAGFLLAGDKIAEVIKK